MGSLYRQQAEHVFIFKCGRKAHINIVRLGSFGRNRTTIWSVLGLAQFGGSRKQALDIHPTVKPVGLLVDALLDTSKPGGLILDPFAGSGTTLLAAQRARRICYAIELDPKYVDAAVRRLTALGLETRHALSGLTFEQTAAHRTKPTRTPRSPRAPRATREGADMGDRSTSRGIKPPKAIDDEAHGAQNNPKRTRDGRLSPTFSGNPKGRPPKPKEDVVSLFMRVLEEELPLEGDDTSRTVFETLMRQTLVHAMGQPRIDLEVLKLFLGGLSGRVEPKAEAEDDNRREAILADLGRQGVCGISAQTRQRPMTSKVPARATRERSRRRV